LKTTSPAAIKFIVLKRPLAITLFPAFFILFPKTAVVIKIKGTENSSF